MDLNSILFPVNYLASTNKLLYGGEGHFHDEGGNEEGDEKEDEANQADYNSSQPFMNRSYLEIKQQKSLSVSDKDTEQQNQ